MNIKNLEFEALAKEVRKAGIETEKLDKYMGLSNPGLKRMNLENWLTKKLSPKAPSLALKSRRKHSSKAKDKNSRGNSSQFFVAGELCRQGYSAVVTLGNCPNTDILVSNIEGTKFVHVQVKTFVPGNRTCSVGLKAEKDFGSKFFWIIAGIPLPDQKANFEYFVIPSNIMAKKIKEGHQLWLDLPGKSGQKHNDNAVRTVHLPPHKSICGWDIRRYKDRWDLIEKKLKA